MKRIFISSVQKEFERERAAIKRMIESDPILKPYFKVFVFEAAAHGRYGRQSTGKFAENATENATENPCVNSRQSICRNAGDGGHDWRGKKYCGACDCKT